MKVNLLFLLMFLFVGCKEDAAVQTYRYIHDTVYLRDTIYSDGIKVGVQNGDIISGTKNVNK